MKLFRPSIGSCVRTAISCPTKRRKCAGRMSGRGMPGDDTSSVNRSR